MNILPNKLILLDDKLQPIGSIPRLRNPAKTKIRGASAIPLIDIGKHLEPVLQEIRIALKALRDEDK